MRVDFSRQGTLVTCQDSLPPPLLRVATAVILDYNVIIIRVGYAVTELQSQF